MLNFVNGAELRALQPGRRGDAGSHHPHEELAADRAGAGGRQARRVQGRCARRGRELHRPGTAPISRATTRASAATRTRSIPCPASCWCRGSACSGLAAPPRRTRASPPTSPRPRSRPSPTPRRSAASSRSREADMFDMEYWPPEQAKLGAAARKPLAGQIVAVTGAGGGIGAATARAFAAAGAEVALLDVKLDAAIEQAKPIGGAAVAVRRDRRRFGARGVRPGRGDLRRARHPGVECRRDAAARQIGEVDEAVIAQELRAQFLRPPARRAGRGEDHAGARHRRLPAVQRLEAGDQSGAELRPLRPAQGRDPVPVAPIRARLRRRRHPLQRGQRRPHPLRHRHRRLHPASAPRRAACPRRNT